MANQKTQKSTTQGDQNKLLKGLELRENIGGLVEPFTFTAATRTELHHWFDDVAIDQLQDLTESARHIERDKHNEPTLGDNRAVLERIQSLAAALAQAIEQSPGTTYAVLTLIGHRDFGELFKFKKMANDLVHAASRIESELEKMPLQSTRDTPVFLVSCIAQIAEKNGIKISSSEQAKFFSLCRCVFEAAGLYQDPRGAIRTFMASRA